jgi:HK97 gp10 family phage protein
MAKTTIKVEGLKELNDALAELPKATGRNVVRRALIKALGPMERQAEGLAPELTGELRRTIETSTKLSKKQMAAHTREYGGKAVRTAEGFRSDPKTEVFMFMGPAGSAKSIVQEFGSVNQSPKPYMRPAWDSGAMPALSTIKAELWTEIDKAAKRFAAKAAKNVVK